MPAAGPVTPLTQAAGLSEVQAVLGEPHGLPWGGGEGRLGGRPAAATALRLRLQPVVLSFQLLYFTLRRVREKLTY